MVAFCGRYAFESGLVCADYEHSSVFVHKTRYCTYS